MLYAIGLVVVPHFYRSIAVATTARVDGSTALCVIYWKPEVWLGCTINRYESFGYPLRAFVDVDARNRSYTVGLRYFLPQPRLHADLGLVLRFVFNPRTHLHHVHTP